MKRNASFPEFDMEGHRGARGLMPENTIPAMFKAMDVGVTTLEMDAHVTADKQVILSHDAYINHLFARSPDGTEISKEASKKLALYQMSYSEIKKYDVGSKYYDKFPEQQKQKAHIPLLADVIDSVQARLKLMQKPQLFYNIETKSKPAGDNELHPEPEVFVKLLMDVIESKKITPWVIIQSFDPRTLQVLHKKYPKVKTSLLVDKNSMKENLKKLGFIPAVYSPHVKLVTADLVKECHAKKMKVIPWTANSREEIAQMKSLGVDGIISDYPNLFNQ
jgi:glycerophosphoryl diester phosphodiesterase